ncbi:hypothetical protein JXA56_01435 [Candidatus Micrarchaeota archaeon]|nr:hypothetical protein [Candidatus Micrarchaeota archaeon]
MLRVAAEKMPANAPKKSSLPPPLVEPRAGTLWELLEPLFTRQVAENLIRIIEQKRYSYKFIANRVNKLKCTAGKKSIAYILAHSPSRIYSGEKEFGEFLRLQRQMSKARAHAKAGMKEVGFVPDRETLKKLAIHPHEIQKSILLFKTAFGDAWANKLREKLEIDPGFFLLRPQAQRAQVKTIQKLESKKEGRKAKLAELEAALREFIPKERLGELLSIYLMRLHTITPETALERLARTRPHICREYSASLPWSAFFSRKREFEEFEDAAKNLSPVVRTEIKGKIGTLIGSELAAAYSFKCSENRFLERTLDRLTEFQNQYPEELQKAAADAPQSFLGTPARYSDWIVEYKKRKAKQPAVQKEREKLEERLYLKLGEIFDQEKAEEQINRRTLSLKTSLNRISQLEAEHPADWKEIIRRRPAAVLYASLADFEESVRVYYALQNDEKNGEELKSRLTRSFGRSIAEKVFGHMRVKRHSSESLLFRMDEIESICGTSFPPQKAWLLTTDKRHYDNWVANMRSFSDVFAMIQTAAPDDLVQNRLHYFMLADARAMKGRKRTAQRLRETYAKKGSDSLRDVLIRSWTYVRTDSPHKWKARMEGKTGTLVSLQHVVDQLGKYRLKDNFSFLIAKEHVILSDSGDLGARLYADHMGRHSIRFADLHLVSTYAKLNFLKSQCHCQKIAATELEKLLAKKRWTTPDHARLWVIREYAIKTKNRVLLTRMSSSKEKGIARMKNAFDSGMLQSTDYFPNQKLAFEKL